MTKRFFSILMFVAISFTALFSQKGDPILFSVKGNPVHVSEFTYIYSKTNGNNADFSKESLQEYLDLYIKFKLKVQKAKDLRLDTIPALNQELEGYRRQLADSYLIDKGVADKLIKEAYERIQFDVDISHILTGIKPEASPADTLLAFNTSMDIKKRIENGDAFALVAKEVSTDNSAVKNGGHIGYVSAIFPKGLYQLETAAYNNPVNKLVGPIRSSAGYHLLLVHDKRAARGEMEAAHILIRKKKQDVSSEAAKNKIDEIYASLKKGDSFEEIATKMSEDSRTANNKGYIGFFGINRYEKSFEDAAFALEKDDDISMPIETSSGWHIIKRISKKEVQPFNIEKSRLNGKIRKAPRFEAAKLAMLVRIKRENNFKEHTKVLDEFITGLTDTFLTFRWKAPKNKSPEALFSLGKNFKVTLGDFTDYLGKASRKRLRMSRKKGADFAARTLYADYVDENLLKYEESQLTEKYPEFKALMREYEEGILLFETTKILVWDKASEDTIGLDKFYETIRGKYRWGERAVTDIYKISAKHKDKAPEILAFIKDHTAEEVKAKFNTNGEAVVSVQEKKIEKLRNQDIKKMKWAAGEISGIETHPRSGKIKIFKIKEIISPIEKKLKEARGYVVADYQDFLEKKWVEELEKEYEVVVNKKAFKKLIQKK